MCPFLRHALLLGLIALPAAADPLPTDTLLFASNRSGNYGLFSIRPDGSHQQQLTRDPAYDNWWPKPSPDRQQILFTRAPKGKHDNYTEASTWLMNADGSNVRPPDGTRIAIVGGSNANPQLQELVLPRPPMSTNTPSTDCTEWQRKFRGPERSCYHAGVPRSDCQ